MYFSVSFKTCFWAQILHKRTQPHEHTNTTVWANPLIYSLFSPYTYTADSNTHTHTHWEEITLNLVSGGVNAAGSNRVTKLFERWDEVQHFHCPLSASALMCWWPTGVSSEGGGVQYVRSGLAIRLSLLRVALCHCRRLWCSSYALSVSRLGLPADSSSFGNVMI